MEHLFDRIKKLQRSILQNKMASYTTLILALGTGGITACSKFTPAEPLMIVYREVLDPSRDTLFVVHNTNRDSSAYFTFEETLSDTAVVFFSNDRSFLNRSGMLFPLNKAVHFGIRGITSDTIFIKYQPLKLPISGSLKIGTYFR